VRKLSAKKFPKTTPTHHSHPADDRRCIRQHEIASTRSLGVRVRARGGGVPTIQTWNQNETGHKAEDGLAPLTWRSKPNQTNQTHTNNGQRGHDSSFECTLQLVWPSGTHGKRLSAPAFRLYCSLTFSTPQDPQQACICRMSAREFSLYVFLRPSGRERPLSGGSGTEKWRGVVVSGTYLPTVSALPDCRNRSRYPLRCPMNYGSTQNSIPPNRNDNLILS